MTISRNSDQQAINIQRYYQLQSRIYDATRWAFLFGRKNLIKQLPFDVNDDFNALEVGCGTGHILYQLGSHYPRASMTGLDISASMLNKAAKKLNPISDRVILYEGTFNVNWLPPVGYDVIIFSYTLTMLNPNWPYFLHLAQFFLNPSGKIAIVDFHDTDWSAYKRFMALNHLNVEGKILPYIQQQFQPEFKKISPGLFGIWRYFNFIGSLE